MALTKKLTALLATRAELDANLSNKLRKSILQQAIQGLLVEQNPDDEPASILLEKIKAEKERLIKEKKIKRDKNGFITDATIVEMRDALPIEVFANFYNKPHRRISTTEELESYLFGAIPYALTTYYRRKDE